MCDVNMTTTEEELKTNEATASPPEQASAEVTDDNATEDIEEDNVAPQKTQQEIEKEEEAKLKSKYPGVKGPGSSAFLQKRLSKGTKYFDSGDYNMAKAKTPLPPGVADPAFKKPLPPPELGSVISASAVPLRPSGGPSPTGSAIPTPDCVAHRRLSHLQSKLATNL